MKGWLECELVENDDDAQMRAEQNRELKYELGCGWRRLKEADQELRCERIRKHERSIGLADQPWIGSGSAGREGMKVFRDQETLDCSASTGNERKRDKTKETGLSSQVTYAHDRPSIRETTSANNANGTV